MSPVAIALSLICAWSQPNCDAAQHNAIHYGPAYAGGASWYDARQHVISVSDHYSHPVVVAALLAHETQNALGDWSGGLTHCVENETAAEHAGYHFWLWFGTTFGYPDFATLTLDEAHTVSALQIRSVFSDEQARLDCSIAKP